MTISQLGASKQRKVSSCDFEIDGVGPWCSTKKDVPVVDTTGAGSFDSTAGTVDFDLNNTDVRVGDDNLGLTGQATPETGGGVVSLNFGGEHELVAYYAFLSEYGNTLTPSQRSSKLMNRAPGVSYQQAFDAIYTSITCTVR